MSHILLMLLAVTYFGISPPSLEPLSAQIINYNKNFVNEVSALPLVAIKEMLEQSSLNKAVIEKVLTTLKCASAYNVARNNILTVIDYTLPSNEKRLWVFDLKDLKLLFHTHVSHGIASGSLVTDYFSNKYNSKASSIGVYKTEKAYYGREGLSLRLDGLDRNFNDNASNRSIVMHGGWYVQEEFIKRYGRPGRSWGCPAIPLSAYQPIINTIKDNSLLVAYYPNEAWFGKSRFLNCQKMAPDPNAYALLAPKNVEKPREYVLFANTSPLKHADDHPIVVMSADNYERIFHAKAPLERMLRRQINHAEYIALSTNEFQTVVDHNNANDKEGINAVFFVVPVLKMVRGYYETQMQIVDMGRIKAVQPSGSTNSSYQVSFESKPALQLSATNRFIRWLGL